MGVVQWDGTVRGSSGCGTVGWYSGDDTVGVVQWSGTVGMI